MQVLYLGRAPRTKETLPEFSKVASGNPTSTCIPRVDGYSTDPRVLGRHSLVSELRYTITCSVLGMGLGYAIFSAVPG